MGKRTRAFLRGVRGSTAIEYGLIVAAVAVVISVIIFTIGEDLGALLSDLGGSLSGPG